MQQCALDKTERAWFAVLFGLKWSYRKQEGAQAGLQSPFYEVDITNFPPDVGWAVIKLCVVPTRCQCMFPASILAGGSRDE